MPGSSTANATVWIDTSGHVREMRYEYILTQTSGAKDLEISTYSVISDIGQEVAIEPPADAIALPA